MAGESASVFQFGRGDVGPSDVIAFAEGRYRAMLDPSDEYRTKIERGAEVVLQRVSADGRSRTPTSEVREASDRGSEEVRSRLRRGFVRHHGCGLGDVLSDRQAAAVLAARLASLCRGFSGVRLELLTLLCEMLNLRVLPRIPSLGGSGAHADLVPLSYLAAAVCGDGEVSYLGRVVTADDGFKAARLQPLALRPREALAIMNGTGVMTALGCIAWDRARRFARFSASLSCMALDVVGCRVDHLDPRVDGLKPHPGARSISEWMREDAEYAGRSPGAGAHAPELLRAAGQALGVQLDAAAFAERCLQVELNSVSDDPIVHPGSGELLLGGNFYGGATTLALDAMKSAVFGAASYLERVLALVCDPRRNGGLPQDLADPNHAPAQGFRAMRGVVGGLLNDAVMLAAPSGLQAGLGSRDSELASAGTQAARRCLDVLELAESIAAIAALALCQAVDLRDGRGCHRRSKAIYGAVRQLVPRLQEDRAQDRDITSVLELFRAGLLPVGQSA